MVPATRSCQHAAGKEPKATRKKENSTDIQSVYYSHSEQKSLYGYEEEKQRNDPPPL